MAVLIDPPSWPAHGRRWSHLISDTSLAELHDFASGLGIPDRGFEGDHYDVPEQLYPAAVAAGAVPVSARELLRRLQLSGLRVPKRRGERVLASWTQDRERIDLLRSRLTPLAPPRRVHLAVATTAAVLVRDGGHPPELPSVLLPPQTDPAVAASALLRALLRIPPPAGSPPEQAGYLRGTPVAGAPWSEPVLRWRVSREHAPSGQWLAVDAAITDLGQRLGLLLAVQHA